MKHLYRSGCWVAALLLVLTSCGSQGKQTTTTATAEKAVQVVEAPAFNADSAYQYVDEQCAFGPRTMNSKAHDLCGDYIVAKFKEFGAEVTEQKTDVMGYNGTMLRCRNIIASVQPELTDRVMICGHWDSRPWADNDADEANWHKPIIAANDAASPVGVMLEMARAMQQQKPNVGVDFICFDAEDWGTPQWEEQTQADADSWCLGSTYWARNPHKDDYRPRFGVLLDMVGGVGTTFSREQMSVHYAKQVVDKVWNAAAALGHSGVFINRDGGAVTDDHIPVNRIANIPCIDIIPYAPECEASSFGATWHTVSDDMQHIDRNLLKAVGETMMQVVFAEQ